jgi:hypothetical protein
MALHRSASGTSTVSKLPAVSCSVWRQPPPSDLATRACRPVPWREVIAVYVAVSRVYLQHGRRRYDLTDGQTTIVCRAQGAPVARYAIVRDGLEVAPIRVRLPLLTLLSYGDDLDCEQDDLLFYLSQSPGFVSWTLETWRDSG